MKQFSVREFALLCSPLLVIAVVGFLFSRRKPPSPDADKVHLEFHVEKPTALEAFQGIDAAFVVQLKGPNTDYKSSANPLHIWQSDPFMEVQTANGLQKSRGNSTFGVWNDVWKGVLNGTRIKVNSRAIPAGKLRFGMDAVLALSSSSPSKTAPRASGLWTVNRALIQPFDFNTLPKAPLVRVVSAKVIEIQSNGNVRGETVFDLTGEAMGKQTAFDSDFSVRNANQLSSGAGNSDLTPETATRRVRDWTVYKQFGLATGQKQIVYLSGRVSADQRWPLAFEFEPFDYAKAKVGQQLNFKSWPASVPKL